MSFKRKCLPVLDCDYHTSQGCDDSTPLILKRCHPRKYSIIVGPCDYEPGPFEKAMAGIVYKLQKLGADIVAKYGEASPRFVVSFQTLRGKDVRIQQVDGDRHTNVQLIFSESGSGLREGEFGTEAVQVALCFVVEEIRWRLNLSVDALQ